MYEASIFASFFHRAEAWRQVLADLLGTREENAWEVMDPSAVVSRWESLRFLLVIPSTVFLDIYHHLYTCPVHPSPSCTFFATFCDI